MYKYQYKFFILLLCFSFACCTSWDFAVTTKSKIVFFDEKWNEIKTAGHQFTHMTALSFDESEDVIYFSDQEHLNGSIFSMQLSSDKENYANSMQYVDIIENVIQRTQNETIAAIAYDPLNRQIYWTDMTQHKIFYANVTMLQNVETPKVLLDLGAQHKPDGLALDMCRRKLYWTNANFKKASIESIDLESKERKMIISDNLFMPHGIVVDQLSDRIYWVEDQQGHYFSVDSANLNGDDRRTEIQGINNVPLHLAVTPNYIYWTDQQQNAVWKYKKGLNNHTAENVMSFEEEPYGIVAHSNYLTNLKQDKHCQQLVEDIKKRLKNNTAYNNYVVDMSIENYCLHGGESFSNFQHRKCICKTGWTGERCETSLCHNYCLQDGTCSISQIGTPECKCALGYQGNRCELHKCKDYCLNDGICRLKENGETECECSENFDGARCEHNSTEICALYCRVLQHEPEIYVPFGCHDICSAWADEGYTLPVYKHLEKCKTNRTVFNDSLILVLTTGIVLCLLLVLLIVLALRRVYKPARPRIKKTFVVRKEAARNCLDTPLTNRPQIATEQCEITIENCCNMNICETPCFDPKLMQQSMSSYDAHLKDDRKMLIPNTEDDLY